MSLVIETGAIVPDANSWVERATFIAYAASKGITVADADTADVALVKAAAFVNESDPALKGTRVSRSQFTSYPRSGLVLQGFSWRADEIPELVKRAQMELALDVNAGVDLHNIPANPSRPKKSVGVEQAIDVSYFGSDKDVQMRRGSSGLALLYELMGPVRMTLERV